MYIIQYRNYKKIIIDNIILIFKNTGINVSCEMKTKIELE